jgi:2-amino-4-hydroxy-6-hydroxymethyldihydropteridine diphosphokinase
MATCLVSLGSNLGDRRQFIEQAIARIDAHRLIQVTARSRLYETKPIGGPPRQDSFFNAAIKLETSLPADGLLRFLQETESQLGRTRDERWSARTIDLDLLLYDDVVALTDELTLPHPRMAFRRFVLEPAAEVAADCAVPLAERTIDELLQHVKSLPNYVEISGDTRAAATEVAIRVATTLNDQHGVNAQLLKDPLANDHADGPPAGTTGHSMAAAIEFLRRRSEVLDTANWADPNIWFVSDFGSRVLYEPGWMRVPEFLAAYCEFIARTRNPKIEVVLKTKTLGSPDFVSNTMFESIDNLDVASDHVIAAILAMHDVPQLVT